MPPAPFNSQNVDPLLASDMEVKLSACLTFTKTGQNEFKE